MQKSLKEGPLQPAGLPLMPPYALICTKDSKMIPQETAWDLRADCGSVVVSVSIATLQALLRYHVPTSAPELMSDALAGSFCRVVECTPVTLCWSACSWRTQASHQPQGCQCTSESHTSPQAAIDLTKRHNLRSCPESSVAALRPCQLLHASWSVYDSGGCAAGAAGCRA